MLVSARESKRKKLTNMLLDDTITKEAYDEKYNDFTDKINQYKNEKELLTLNLDSQKNIRNRMKDVRESLSEADVLDEFDRVVFESIVEKVIVGETNEDGSVDSYKLTFVLKGNGYKAIPDVKERYTSLFRKAN